MFIRWVAFFFSNCTRVAAVLESSWNRGGVESRFQNRGGIAVGGNRGAGAESRQNRGLTGIAIPKSRLARSGENRDSAPI